MTREEALVNLQMIKSKGVLGLRLLEVSPRTLATEHEIRSLVSGLKDDLQREYERTSPESSQKKMTIFELSVYSPTIEETWTTTGIRRLKVDGAISEKWSEVFEATIYAVSKYIS
jgi:hypothetical protein